MAGRFNLRPWLAAVAILHQFRFQLKLPCSGWQASAADELRATVASLEEDVRQAAEKNAKLLKNFQNHEENNRHSVEKVGKAFYHNCRYKN